MQKHVNHDLDKYSLEIEMSLAPTDKISLTTPNLRLLLEKWYRQFFRSQVWFFCVLSVKTGRSLTAIVGTSERLHIR